MALEVQNEPDFLLLITFLYLLTSSQFGVEAESWHGETGALQSLGAWESARDNNGWAA